MDNKIVLLLVLIIGICVILLICLQYYDSEQKLLKNIRKHIIRRKHRKKHHKKPHKKHHKKHHPKPHPKPPSPKPPSPKPPSPYDSFDCVKGRCVETVNGNYPTLSMCKRGCRQPPGPAPPQPPPSPSPPSPKKGLWECVSNICIPKIGGSYRTQKECKKKCKLPPATITYWQCDETYKKCHTTTTPDPNKPKYRTRTECAINCILHPPKPPTPPIPPKPSPTLWWCDKVQGKCTTTKGTGIGVKDKSTCEKTCQEPPPPAPVTGYICDTTQYQCIADPTKTSTTSLKDCQTNCVKPPPPPPPPKVQQV